MPFFSKSLSVIIVSLLSSQTLIACKPTPTPDTPITNNPLATGQNLSGNTNPTSQNSTAYNHTSQNNVTSATTQHVTSCNNQAIYRAFSARNDNQKTQVLGCGHIKKLLKDDNDGTRHQKFLLSIEGYPQITVLVAHNIDLAKRVDNIVVNTPIRFYGEYIYNDKGGVLHWTHKDPAARHQNGWLEYQGQKYW